MTRSLRLSVVGIVALLLICGCAGVRHGLYDGAVAWEIEAPAETARICGAFFRSAAPASGQ